MLVRILLWSLADSKTTVAELRRHLRDEGVAEHADVEGLRFAAWVSDAGTERWGAVQVWESAEAAQGSLPPRIHELIGRDPDIGEEFDVEATAEGRFAVEALTGLGLAFEEP